MNYHHPVRVEFPTRIDGIPCRIEAQITPGHVGGFFETPQPTEVDFEVFDQRGRRADWPRQKLDQEDIRQIETEAFEVERENRELV